MIKESGFAPVQNLQAATLLPAAHVKSFGSTLVVAPHPDDETLGCGGTIALLRQFRIEVSVLVISDGTMSHPNSKSFPASRLRILRENETLEGVGLLGVTAENVKFLRLKDSKVPVRNAPDFDDAVKLSQNYLKQVNPNTVLIPWRRDPHPDHRATTEILRAAIEAFPRPPRIIEYLVWTWERAVPEDLPCSEEASAYKINIEAVLHQKQRAINCYRSQVSNLIDDDPEGFWLSPQVLEHFKQPSELFLEEINDR